MSARSESCWFHPILSELIGQPPRPAPINRNRAFLLVLWFMVLRKNLRTARTVEKLQARGRPVCSCRPVHWAWHWHLTVLETYRLVTEASHWLLQCRSFRSAWIPLAGRFQPMMYSRSPFLAAMMAGLLAFEALQGLPRPARGTHGSLKVAAYVLVKAWFAAPPPCTFHCFVRKVKNAHRRYTSCAGSQSKSFTWFLCAF